MNPIITALCVACLVCASNELAAAPSIGVTPTDAPVRGGSRLAARIDQTLSTMAAELGPQVMLPATFAKTAEGRSALARCGTDNECWWQAGARLGLRELVLPRVTSHSRGVVTLDVRVLSIGTRQVERRTTVRWTRAEGKDSLSAVLRAQYQTILGSPDPNLAILLPSYTPTITSG